MNATHTPGPWQSSGKYPDSEESLFVATVARKDRPIICRIANTVSGRPLDSEDYANAQLIAAAPELLEALKNLVLATKDVSVGHYNEELHDIALHFARAVIAKAEGAA